MGDEVAIGIDLGTTNCCVAVYKNDKVIVIPNENYDGSKTTPSYVAFNEDNSVTVGQIAKDHAFRKIDTTVYDAKRIIGREFSDPLFQHDMTFWPFKVSQDDGTPKIEIGKRLYHPEEVSAKLLVEMKEIAEDFLQLERGTIKKAVITVPAYFNDGQRQATVDAGKLAGLEVLCILNEPTAAAIAYFNERLEKKAKKVIIFDLGGGTLDVALIEIGMESVEVIGIHGDTHLGGEDFDKNMMLYCVEKFKQETGINLLKGVDSTSKQTRDEAKKNLRRLQQTCERHKRTCSSSKGRSTTVVIEGLVNGKDLCVEVTKQTFENVNAELYQKCIRVLDETFAGTPVLKSEVDDIVLVGGSTRMNKIRNMLQSYFDTKTLNVAINPDEAVAYGAAMQAAILTGKMEGKLELKQVQDVTGISLGVGVGKLFARMSVIIPKNTRIPAKMSRRYVGASENQTAVIQKVYQGESKIVAENTLLGTFELSGFPPVKVDEYMCTVIMEINQNGILHVSAVSSDSALKSELTVVAKQQRMSQPTIEKLLTEMKM